jgi:FixJ family two-component response regulator
MGHPSDVLFLDDDDDLRATFADLVRTIFARECHGIGSHHDLVALGERALHCGVAILDINLGPEVPSGIEAYGWLRKHGFEGRIVFLTGHAASHPLVVEARRLGDAEVVSKPVSLDRLTTMLEDRMLEAQAPL